MTRGMHFLLIVMTSMALVSCRSSKPDAAAEPDAASAGYPPFTLRLRMATQDRRYTLFEIERDGTMRFGGGQDAWLDSAPNSCMLSPQMCAQVWSLVEHYDLMHAKSAGLFARSRQVDYQVSIDPQGPASHDFRSIDGLHPGVAALQQLLFQYQASARYNLPQIGAEQRETPSPTLQHRAP
ncbi:MAG: hypothetical protein IT440_03930 [Phycisphaeraceae bacterium]|nr:hypothetical protein [Phycisphaeraceae bacterium]